MEIWGPMTPSRSDFERQTPIIFLDFSLFRCAWRAIRRSREPVDFWLWLLRYRRRSRALLMQANANHAAAAAIHLLDDPDAVSQVALDAVHNSQPRPPVPGQEPSCG